MNQVRSNSLKATQLEVVEPGFYPVSLIPNPMHTALCHVTFSKVYGFTRVVGFGIRVGSSGDRKIGRPSFRGGDP